MVDVDSAKVTVAKVTAPINTWKSKKLWHEKMEAIKIGQTEFGLELRALEASAPDLLEAVLDALVRYLGRMRRRLAIFEHKCHPRIYRYNEDVTIVRVEDSEGTGEPGRTCTIGLTTDSWID